jgi:hypothetical protein
MRLHLVLILGLAIVALALGGWLVQAARGRGAA